MSGRPSLDVTLVIPVYNERENVPLLLEEIARALQPERGGGGPSYEIVAVDDASTDGSLDVLKRLTRDYPELRIVAFAQHAGQTAALAAALGVCGTLPAMAESTNSITFEGWANQTAPRYQGRIPRDIYLDEMGRRWDADPNWLWRAR